MRKASSKARKDELRPEYDLATLKRGVRGKYYRRAMAGTNLVLVDPELAKAFPDADSVNRALRALLDAASATTGASTRARRRLASFKGATRRRVRVAGGR